jgi:hypothetical protein
MRWLPSLSDSGAMARVLVRCYRSGGSAAPPPRSHRSETGSTTGGCTRCIRIRKLA